MTFDSHFEGIYGARWPALRAALAGPAEGKVLLENPFGEGFQDYSLDAASKFPAEAMGVQQGEWIADFCSAPGGKLLTMIFSIQGRARFLACDLSPGRVPRLKAVLHDCLPPEIIRHVEVRKMDSALLGLKYPESFDRALVDAPCSGERHLLHSPEELKRWSVKGSKRLAVRQHALLCAAMDSVKPGGRVVYSTCSISPLENDGVVERLHESREGLFKVLAMPHDLGEPTRFGWLILPDTAGCGPIYTAVLEKI